MDPKALNKNCDSTNQCNDDEIEDSFVIISSDNESLQVAISGDVTNSKVQDPHKHVRNFEEVLEQLKIFKIYQATDDSIVIFSCHDVRLYVNRPDGNVDLIHNNATLRIIQFNETCTYLLSFCLQIVDTARNLEWIYPLDQNNMHCFYTTYGAFILPGLPVKQRQHIDHPDGVTYGLVIPKPANEIVLDILESILYGSIREIPGDSDSLSRASSINVVSNSIVRNSRYISSGLIFGAEKLGEYLGHGANLLKSNLQPTPANEQPVVNEKLKVGIEVTKRVTEAAGNITGKCASAIGTATMSLGRYLAPHIQSKLPNLLSHVGFSEEMSQKSVNHALAIAGGTVEGVSTIFSGIEQSVLILGKNVSHNVVNLVEHKYGENYGKTVETTLDTAGNVISISQNVNFLTPKGLVKRTAKGAGMGFLQASTSTTTDEELVYPDLSGLIKELENEKHKKSD